MSFTIKPLEDSSGPSVTAKIDLEPKVIRHEADLAAEEAPVDSKETEEAKAKPAEPAEQVEESSSEGAAELELEEGEQEEPAKRETRSERIRRIKEEERKNQKRARSLREKEAQADLVLKREQEREQRRQLYAQQPLLALQDAGVDVDHVLRFIANGGQLGPQEVAQIELASTKAQVDLLRKDMEERDRREKDERKRAAEERSQSAAAQAVQDYRAEIAEFVEDAETQEQFPLATGLFEGAELVDVVYQKVDEMFAKTGKQISKRQALKLLEDDFEKRVARLDQRRPSAPRRARPGATKTLTQRLNGAGKRDPELSLDWDEQYKRIMKQNRR